MKHLEALSIALALALALPAVEASAQAAGAPSAAMSRTAPPGLYVQVLDGMIRVSNSGGTQALTTGQFGFTPSFTQPPVVVPRNPGIVFTPPPAFTPASTSGSNAAASTRTSSVDCEVR